MTEATMPVTVEQCDRDAAAALIDRLGGLARFEALGISFASLNNALCEAFARHRLNTRATPPSPAGLAGEPVAWRHTMTYETGETNARLSFDDANPFGRPGRDYSEEYPVVSEPLFLTANGSPPAPAGLAELISTRLLGVRPDDQDLQLEDDDWLAIIAALHASQQADERLERLCDEHGAIEVWPVGEGLGWRALNSHEPCQTLIGSQPDRVVARALSDQPDSSNEGLAELLREVREAADDVLAPLCAKVGRFLYDEPETDAVDTMHDYDVVIPFSAFRRLYDATDKELIDTALSTGRQA